MKKTLTLVLLATGACRAAATAPQAAPEAAPEHARAHGGSDHERGEHGAHGGHHFVDPETYVAAWNSPERDAYQKPAEIIAALNLAPGATVADLGAGTGYLLPSLSAAVGPEGSVIAADIEPAMLAFLDEAASREGWANVRTHRASLHSLALPASSLDGVVTLNTWHHVEDRVAYVSDLAAMLKPGAAFVVVDFLKEDTAGFGPPAAMRLTAEQVVAELDAGGLVAEVLEETMPRHYVVRGVRPTPTP